MRRRCTSTRTPRRAIAELDLDPRVSGPYYDGFCNRTLWPALYGSGQHVHDDAVAWDAYVAVSETFASTVADLAPPDGIVWVHDDHLFLLARALRERGLCGRVGLFVHVPFPAPEIL